MKIPFLPFYILHRSHIVKLQADIKRGLLISAGVGAVAGFVARAVFWPVDQGEAETADAFEDIDA